MSLTISRIDLNIT